MSFSSQKGEFDRFFNRLDRPVEESRPDRQPDRPVDPTGAGYFRKPVRKSANCGLKDLVCGFVVKKIEIYRKSTTSLGSFLQFPNKKRFYDSMYRQIWVDVFLNYNTLSPSSSAVERLFPRGAAILTASWVGWRSRNCQRLVFVKENLDFLKWQRVAQDNFDDMSRTFSK